MKRTITICGLCFCTVCLFAQLNVLKQKVEQITASKKADVGIAVYNFGSKEAFYINGNKHFPMQSVFKFHIALAVLNAVDKGKFSLNQKIHIKKSELLPDTWSPLRMAYPDGNVDLPLSEIISFTVSQSDNNGCDILLRLIGGPTTVESYIHSIGIKNIAIRANEEEMHKGWNVQFENWTTPLGALELLAKFYEGKILSNESFDFLWKIMLETSTGKNRIRAQLPAGILVANKTGTSGTTAKGLTAAVNDIGIVTLPNGEHFGICVFVSNSTENFETNEKVIADIAKVVYDYFTNIPKH